MWKALKNGLEWYDMETYAKVFFAGLGLYVAYRLFAFIRVSFEKWRDAELWELYQKEKRNSEANRKLNNEELKNQANKALGLEKNNHNK